MLCASGGKLGAQKLVTTIIVDTSEENSLSTSIFELKTGLIVMFY
jgi:hypothetical protein